MYGFVDTQTCTDPGKTQRLKVKPSMIFKVPTQYAITHRVLILTLRQPCGPVSHAQATCAPNDGRGFCLQWFCTELCWIV